MSTHPPLIVPSRKSLNPALTLIQTTINAVSSWESAVRKRLSRSTLPHDLLCDVLCDNDLRPREQQMVTRYVSGAGFE